MLAVEKAQLTKTSTEASSLRTLAGDKFLNRALEAGGAVANLIPHPGPTVTYVWALPGPNSRTVSDGDPCFAVSYANVPG
jgi:hypothetical protein